MWRTRRSYHQLPEWSRFILQRRRHPFVDITSFPAYVGGSPTNIVVGANRFGVKARS